MGVENPTLTHDELRSQRTSTPEIPSGRIFYGWWVVLASAIGLFWGVPITVYSFSVFFKPLMQEFHAGRAAVSLAFTLKLFAAAFCAAPIGWLTDRYGVRRVILSGTGIFGALLLANRLFSGSIIQFYCFYALVGCCVGAIGPIPYGFLISHWFDRRRGLALGLTMLGIGLGAVIMPALAQVLIARFGWKTAYAILGAAVLLICWPALACLVKDSPGNLGLFADGASAKTGSIQDVRRGLTAREAWHSRDFRLMAGAFILVSASVQACVVHMAPMFNDRNLGMRAAALGSSLIGAAVMVGRVGTGYLLDRTFASRLASILFAVSASGIALLWLGNGRSAFAGAFLVGLGLGAEIDLIPYLASRYFGLRDFGKIYSSLFAAFALAGALGPLIMGAGYDRTGSYSGPLVGFLLAILLATVLMTRLGPYRFRAPEPNMGLLTEHENCAQKTQNPNGGTTSVDTNKLNEFLGRFINDLGASVHAGMVVIGERLGLYKALAQEPMTSAELAKRTNTDERYVREWAASQAAGGYLTYEPKTEQFGMTEEQILTLAREDGPAYLPGAFELALGSLAAVPRITEAFRSGAGMGWFEHEERVFHGCEKFFRPGYAANLITSWIPSLDGVNEKLARGAKVADVGCGKGASTILMAKAFPQSEFHGFDYHDKSIEMARTAAEREGVADRVSFDVAAAKEFPGSDYDFVSVFDCLHDMGDPVGAATHVRRAIKNDGSWMIVEPFANDDLQDNLNPVGRVYYSFSTLLCTPCSRSQEGGMCLGAQAGQKRMREVVSSAGFTRFRRATETPFNLVYEARP